MIRQQQQGRKPPPPRFHQHSLIVILACFVLHWHDAHAFRATVPRTNNPAVWQQQQQQRHFARLSFPKIPSYSARTRRTFRTAIATTTTTTTTALHLSSLPTTDDAFSSSLLLLSSLPLSSLPSSLSATTTTTTSTTDFVDWLYHAQAMAGNLANTGLHQNIVISLPVMYAAGLLTSVSPCVWGLLPLTMSYIR